VRLHNATKDGQVAVGRPPRTISPILTHSPIGQPSLPTTPSPSQSPSQTLSQTLATASPTPPTPPSPLSSPPCPQIPLPLAIPIHISQRPLARPLLASADLSSLPILDLQGPPETPTGQRRITYSPSPSPRTGTITTPIPFLSPEQEPSAHTVALVPSAHVLPLPLPPQIPTTTQIIPRPLHAAQPALVQAARTPPTRPLVPPAKSTALPETGTGTGTETETEIETAIQSRQCLPLDIRSTTPPRVRRVRIRPQGRRRSTPRGPLSERKPLQHHRRSEEVTNEIVSTNVERTINIRWDENLSRNKSTPSPQFPKEPLHNHPQKTLGPRYPLFRGRTRTPGLPRHTRCLPARPQPRQCANWPLSPIPITRGVPFPQSPLHERPGPSLPL
jgi:hypothetical protein